MIDIRMYGYVEINIKNQVGEFTFDNWKAIIRLDRWTDYGLFYNLFYESHGKHFIPIAANRGLPKDATPETIEIIGHITPKTWISFDEIKKNDWNEQRLHPEDNDKDHLGLTRREHLSSFSKMLFSLMNTLGKEFGDENVRMVVGLFDSCLDG